MRDTSRPIDPSSPAARRSWPGSNAMYCDPSSLRTIVPGLGLRRHEGLQGVSDGSKRL